MDASGSGPTPSSALPGGLGASRLSGLLLGAGAARWHLWSAGAGEQLRARWPYLAALGAGCLVGAGGVFLAQRLSRRVATLTSHDSSASITRELTSLHVTVRDLREAVRELKETQRQEGGTARRGGKNGRLKSALRTVTFSDVDEAFKERSEEGDEEDEDETLNGGASSTTMTTTNSTTEFFSCISSEEEYFDLPEDEDAAAAEGGTSASEDKRPRAESDIILELFRAVDDLLEGGQGEQRKALRLLRARQEQLGENSEFLWRLSKAIYLGAVAAEVGGSLTSGSPDSANNNMMLRSDDAACANAKRALIEEAVECGRRAVESNEMSSEAHKWYAIAVGSRGEFVSIREKILDGFEFKRHVDRAAELAPQDHTIQHLLGRFCYEVAELSWWERKMAGTLFAEPPTASMEEALQHFLSAEHIKPEGWKENRQFVAKTMLKLGRADDAVAWLKKAEEMPIKNPDDRQAHEEIELLLAKFSGAESAS